MAGFFVEIRAGALGVRRFSLWVFVAGGYDCVSEGVLWDFESVRVEELVKGGGWVRSSKTAAGRDGREGFKGQVGAVIEDFGAVELGCQRAIGQG